MNKLTNQERINKLKEDLAKNFNLHKDAGQPKFWSETESSFCMYGNCGCHQQLMDSNCEGECQPYLPALEQLVHKHGAWIEMNDSEGMTIWLDT